MANRQAKPKKALQRIGLRVTVTNTTFEADFALVITKEITLHSHRLLMSGDIENEDFVNMVNAGVGEVARFQSMAKVEVIAYGFTTGSFYRGIDCNRELTEQIQKAAEIPAITPATAMINALRYFRAEKISVGTIYPEWNNAMLLAYLKAVVFHVINLEGALRPANTAIHEPM